MNEVCFIEQKNDTFQVTTTFQVQLIYAFKQSPSFNGTNIPKMDIICSLAYQEIHVHLH